MEQLKVLTVFWGLWEKLNRKASTWPVKNFEPIENANFQKLPDDIVDDLSSDQYYGYGICLAVMSG